MQENTLEVLRARYFLKDKDGKIVEDWEGLCRRTASRAADGVLFDGDKTKRATERWTDLVNNFINIQFNQEFIANSPVYFNVGTKREMGSACFIIPVGDSIAEIYQAVKNGAMVEKLGGGIGMDFSGLRATNSPTSIGGKASGAVSFMTAFDTMTQTIKQGGKRRGAMMAMLDVTHPEILSFIDCKQKTPTERVTYLVDKHKLKPEQAEEVLKDLEWRAPFSNFNITVKVPDDFMNACAGDKPYALKNPNGTYFEGEVDDPRNNIAVKVDMSLAESAKTLRANDILDRIIEKAWQSGEPGIGFIDRINKDNPVASLSKIYNSNPCGEYWQIPFSSCNLGSINLSKVYNGETEPGKVMIDWNKLAKITELAVQFLEGILTINEYPIPEVTEITKNTRPIGLGIMGFADLLLKMKVKYGSAESIKLAEEIMLWINYHAWVTSTQLAKVKGKFTHYEANKQFFTDKFKTLEDDFNRVFGIIGAGSLSLVNGHRKYGVRHCQVSTIAPTGTICLFAECSSGCEPNFAYELKRQDTISTRFYTHWFLEEWEKNNKGKPLPDYAVEAHDVTPEQHILIQAAFQKYCDNGVSKTINLPESATKDDVRKAYMLAYETGCKSVTVYRDGCREGVLLHNKPKEEKKEVAIVPAKKPLDSNGNYMHRPEFLPGATWKVKAPGGTVYVTVNYSPEEQRIVEVFVRENSGNEAWELAGRLLSVLLRSGTSTKQISKQLLRTRGQSTIVLDGQILTSVAQAIAVLLERADKYFSSPVLSLTENVPLDEMDVTIEGPLTDPEKMSVREMTKFLEQNCPDCGGRTLYRTEGCTKCIKDTCGYTKCGG